MRLLGIRPEKQEMRGSIELPISIQGIYDCTGQLLLSLPRHFKTRDVEVPQQVSQRDGHPRNFHTLFYISLAKFKMDTKIPDVSDKTFDCPRYISFNSRCSRQPVAILCRRRSKNMPRIFNCNSIHGIQLRVVNYLRRGFNDHPAR